VRLPGALLNSIVVIITGILPFMFVSGRVDGHETYRAGIVGILALTALPNLRWRGFSRQQKYLLAAVLLWGIALGLSSFFAISPSRALFGDFFRRMGLWTHLALLCLIFLGSAAGLKNIWRWFWLASVIVAAHVVLEFLASNGTVRPRSLLGWSTFSGGWLMLAFLWAAAGLWSERSALNRWQGMIYAFGLSLNLAALVLLGARGAAVALGGGLVTGGLLWSAVHRERRWSVLFILLFALLSGGVVVVSRMDWGAQQNLFARLDQQPDSFRRQVWSEALAITTQWPTLSAVDGEIDRWAMLRPIVGYGLETFEPLSKRVDVPVVFNMGDTPVDRAHNEWFDTLIAAGWGGLGARLILWISIGWLALYRLRLLRRWRSLLSCIGVGTAASIYLTWNTSFLPLALTLAVIASFWLWLLWGVWRRSPANDHPKLDSGAWLALSALVAHVIELQFNFVTIATTFPAYLAFGLLLVPEKDEPNDNSVLPTGIWLAVGGASLIYGLSGVQHAWMLIPLLFLATLTAYFVHRFSWRYGFLIVGLWVVAALLNPVTSPEIRALTSLAILIIAFMWLTCACKPHWNEILQRRYFFWGAALVLTLVCWWRDLTADYYLQAGRIARRQENYVDAAAFTQFALAFRPWDDYLNFQAGNAQLRAVTVTMDVRQAELGLSHLRNALALNPYDVDVMLRLAQAHAEIALVSSERERYWREAKQYFAAAARLHPSDASVWRRWARYTLDVGQDPLTAYHLILKAEQAQPDRNATRQLRARIETELAARGIWIDP
jgi:hypothetical protein